MLRAHMTRLNRFSFLFALAVLFILSACQSTDGEYSPSGWDYRATTNASAQQSPKHLSENYNKNEIEQNTNNIQEASISSMSSTPVQPVRVAILLPLTGQHSSLGKSMFNAAQMAMFDVGHDSFELIPHDTKGSPEGARIAAQAAIKEKAQLVLGPVFANAVRAAKPILRSGNINMIAFSTNWHLAGGNTFIMGFLPFDQIERITGYVASRNLNNIAVIAPQTNYGNAVISAYRSAAPRYGLKTTDITTFHPQSSNLAPTIRSFTKYDERTAQANTAANIIASKQETKINLRQIPPPFDAILMPVGGDLARSISNLLSHYDIIPNQVRRLGTGLMDDAGLASENSLDGAWFAAPSPNTRKSFEQRFLSLYDYNSPRLSSLAYDATALSAILAQRGLQTNGHPSFDKRSISNPNGFAGVDGIFRFRPDGTAERGLAILGFKHGKITIIDSAPTTFQQSFKY